MKIRKLQLKNIGVFDDEEIEFKECPVKDKAEIHILTGGNGSGKSTILMALASVFDTYHQNNQIRTNNFFYKRFHHINSSKVKVDFGSVHNPVDVILNPSNPAQFYSSNSFDELNIYKNILNQSFKPINEFDFVVIAYSGYRFVRTTEINIIKEPNENPLFDSLEFIKNPQLYNRFTINQWIANNLSKEAIAKGKGKQANAEKFANNISNLEKIVSEIVGYKVTFDLNEEQLNLNVIKDNQELDFDVLPDGLKSLISWIGDLLMRLDSLKWKDDTPIFDREIILFLDEIEVHLHPAWQRKVLPVVQKLFKNAQIFVSTHSPFVVNSVDDAWVYKLKVEDGKAKVESVTKSEDGYSYETVLREIFDIDKRFGGKTQEKLESFLKKSRDIFQQNGNSKIQKEKFLEDARSLATESAELQSVVFLELAKLSKKTGETYEI